MRCIEVSEIVFETYTYEVASARLLGVALLDPGSGSGTGGDRTNRDWSKTDGSLLSETYGYETTTARLMSVSVLGAEAQMTPIRNFGYAPSGQVTTDSRAAPDGSANIYSYGINARGRMSTVTLGDAPALF